MKSSIHQSTLHLSFKIKCCVDRLRPPPKSGHPICASPYASAASRLAASFAGGGTLPGRKARLGVAPPGFLFASDVNAVFACFDHCDIRTGSPSYFLGNGEGLTFQQSP